MNVHQFKMDRGSTGDEKAGMMLIGGWKPIAVKLHRLSSLVPNLDKAQNHFKPTRLRLSGAHAVGVSS